jgi:hypothetical protein
VKKSFQAILTQGQTLAAIPYFWEQPVYASAKYNQTIFAQGSAFIIAVSNHAGCLQ